MAEQTVWVGVFTNRKTTDSRQLEALALKLLDDLYTQERNEVFIEIVQQKSGDEPRSPAAASTPTAESVILQHATCWSHALGSLDENEQIEIESPRNIERGLFLQMWVGEIEFLHRSAIRLSRKRTGMDEGWSSTVGPAAAVWVDELHLQKRILIVDNGEFKYGHFCDLNTYVTDL